MCFTVWCVIRGTLRFFFLHDQGALEFYTYGHTLSLHDALPISEIDVVVFLVSRHFGLKNFGGLYGGLLAALSIGTALGPLAAAQIYDRTGSYEMFLWLRSEEHTSELQSLMRISYAVFCLKKKKNQTTLNSTRLIARHQHS